MGTPIGTLENKVNHAASSVWFSPDFGSNTNTRNIRVTVKSPNDYCVSLYDQIADTTILRLQYEHLIDRFSISTVDTSISTGNDTVLDNFSELNDEARFFQDSMIKNFGDLSFDDSRSVLELCLQLKERAQELLDAY